MTKLSVRMISALKSAANSGTGVMACDGRTGEALIRRGYAVRIGRRGYQRTLEGAAALDPQVAQESEDRIKTEVAAMMAIMDEIKAEDAAKLLVGSDPIQARPVAITPGAVYHLATDPQTHIMRATSDATLCGEPAQRREVLSGLTLVDCLVCLDRYTEETRPKACLTY